MCNDILPETLEEKIVATSDAMAQIKSPFFFVNMINRKGSPEKHLEWIKKKLDIDFNKRIFFEDEKEDIRKCYEVLRDVCE